MEYVFNVKMDIHLIQQVNVNNVQLDVKNVIISRKDMLDMGKCVWCKMDFLS